MKAIHGGKAKNDRIDSFKIANLIRSGNFPLAYVYPKAMRAIRIRFYIDNLSHCDLIRRPISVHENNEQSRLHLS